MDFFFFQNNTNFQTILLVNNVSKLFRKLTSRILPTQVYYSKSSFRDSSSILREEQRNLASTKKKTQQEWREKSKEKPSNAWSQRKIKFAQVYQLDSSSSSVRSFFFLLLLHSLFTHSFTLQFLHSFLHLYGNRVLWTRVPREFSQKSSF